MKKPLSVPAAIEYYLDHRHQMGFELQKEGCLLRTLADYARQTQHRGPLTTELVRQWAQLPTKADPHWWARRLAIARQFAQFWVAFDPRTQVPPAGIFGPVHQRPPVHLYTDQEIAQLLDATATLGPAKSPRVATFKTLLGLLTCTGLRISEALRLKPQDLDLQAGTLFLQPSKASPARRIPVHASTCQALQHYDELYTTPRGSGSRPAFFLNACHQALSRDTAEEVFRQLRNHLGWRQPPIPRLHDLRHSFAIRWLARWNEQPGGVAQHILALSAYLGHRHVSDTYWYLTAIPQLLTQSSERFEHLVRRFPSQEVPHA
jgi:integrase